MAKVLEEFPGSNMNEKFNSLVSYCYDEVPKRKKELEQINKQIEDKRNEYFKLCKQLEDIDQLINDLKNIQYYGQLAARRAKNISEQTT